MNNIMEDNPITQGNIVKALLKFFFPILLGSFFQQLYNTVDAIIVGRFVGKEALASVGGSSAVFVNLIVGFFAGITNGGGVIISQFYGAKDTRSLEKSISSSIFMCFLGGLIMSVLGIGFSRPMMVITKCPEAILASSTLYLTIFFCGLIPMFLYNMCSAILRGIGNSKTPLFILIIGCFTNILLDLVFVVFFGMGVAGVAVATVFCQVESALLSIIAIRKETNSFRFRMRELTVNVSMLMKILKIGVPAGLQGCLYTVSNLIIQSNINYFGTDYIAGWAIYGKIDVIFWMTTATFGIALTTFSGQNYGAKLYDRIKKGTWITLGLNLAATVVIFFAFKTFAVLIYRLFTNDGQVITRGVEMLNYLVPFYFIYISIEVLSGTVRGAGRSLAPTLITVFGICFLRLLWLFLVVPKNQTLENVLFTYPLTWAVTSVAFWIYFLSNRWIKEAK